MVIPLNELRENSHYKPWKMRGVSRNLNKNHEQKLEVWPFIHFQWCIGIGTIGESLQSIPTRIFRISAR